jgi:hypothetical protein
VNVTLEGADELVVTNPAMIVRPRPPVSPDETVDGDGDRTAMDCPLTGCPISPGRTACEQATLMLAPDADPFTRPKNVWSGRMTPAVGLAPADPSHASDPTIVPAVNPPKTKTLTSRLDIGSTSRRHRRGPNGHFHDKKRTAGAIVTARQTPEAGSAWPCLADSIVPHCIWPMTP